MPSANVSLRSFADSTESSPSVDGRKVYCAGQPRDVLALPLALAGPELSSALADELLDFYAFIFCQGGFRDLGMTFEQFLHVVATVLQGRLHPSCEYVGDRFP
jgi:hypothetical protein